MSLPTKHIRHQGPVLVSLGQTALAALLGRKGRKNSNGKDGATPTTPGPQVRAELAPLPADLIRDYVRHVGGDPGAYKKVVPPHLWPQWGFPLAARTLRGVPYPMHKVLNGGCRIEIRGAIPAGERLVATARLEDIDDDGRRAVLHQRVVTGTAAEPELLIGHMYAIVPLGGPKGPRPDRAADKEPRKEPARVPSAAREIGFWTIPANAGLAFAMLTGDFNPVHWIKPYAKMFGFRSTILHGFATMARAIEGLNRGVYAGATDRIGVFDCKFTRPLVLPAKVGLYIHDRQVFVGDAPGGPAYLAGSFEENER